MITGIWQQVLALHKGCWKIRESSEKLQEKSQEEDKPASWNQIKLFIFLN